MQHCSNILMIQPVQFGFNPETAVNNSFQQHSIEKNIQEKALMEFNSLVSILTEHQIDVTVIKDTVLPHTPDSIFPNNWISFHEDGTICLFPMFAKNRRQERKPSIIQTIDRKFLIRQTLDFTHYENEELFLEGTGSMVLDRENRIAYACLSNRTHQKVFDDFCEQLKYRPLSFTANDDQHMPIYHTNVMMCVADEYTVICLDSISKEAERNMVKESLAAHNKKIIEISYAQMNCFAGNMLQVHNKDGQRYLVMSSQAYHSLNNAQIQAIEQFNPILHANINNIEMNGGGSARCMMAEIFLPLKS